jgi:hypothetical protein
VTSCSRRSRGRARHFGDTSRPRDHERSQVSIAASLPTRRSSPGPRRRALVAASDATSLSSGSSDSGRRGDPFACKSAGAAGCASFRRRLIPRERRRRAQRVLSATSASRARGDSLRASSSTAAGRRTTSAAKWLRQERRPVVHVVQSRRRDAAAQVVTAFTVAYTCDALVRKGDGPDRVRVPVLTCVRCRSASTLALLVIGLQMDTSL